MSVIPTRLQKTMSPQAMIALRTAFGHPIADEIIGMLTGTSGKGTANGTGVKSYETACGFVHRTRIYLNGTVISVADSGGANGGWGSLKIYDFPLGLIQILGAVTNLKLATGAGISATGTLKHALGTAAAATNDTLSLTKANIVPSTDLVLVDNAGTAQGKSFAAQTLLTDSSAGTPNTTIQALPDPTDTPATADALRDDLVAVHWPIFRNNFADLALAVNNILGQGLGGVRPTFDGTVTAIDLYLNLSVANADISATADVTMDSKDAYVDIFWINLGAPGVV